MTTDTNRLRELLADEAKALRKCRESGTATDALDAWIKSTAKLNRAMHDALPALLDELERKTKALEAAAEQLNSIEGRTKGDKLRLIDIRYSIEAALKGDAP